MSNQEEKTPNIEDNLVEVKISIKNNKGVVNTYRFPRVILNELLKLDREEGSGFDFNYSIRTALRGLPNRDAKASVSMDLLKDEHGNFYYTSHTIE